MNTASRPNATSSRQLHWPRRSSQIGTSGLRDGPAVGSTPRTETTAPAIASAKATTGIAAKRPTMPGDGRPGRQRDEDDGRMDVDRLVVDDRGQELALDEVEDRDQDEEDDRGRCPGRAERHDQQQDRRDEPADVRDEPAEEDDHRQRRRVRHPEDRQEEPSAIPSNAAMTAVPRRYPPTRSSAT